MPNKEAVWRFEKAKKKYLEGSFRSRRNNVLLQTWRGMINRCHGPLPLAGYGGRGISVCDRWMIYDNFKNDMGNRPADGMSLDRINNDGNYEPGNCRWADKYTQVHNRRISSRQRKLKELSRIGLG